MSANRLSPVVLGLVIVNSAIFLAGLTIPNGRDWLLGNGAFWFSRNPNFEVWQAVSYMFLHGGFGHILFNMFGLVSFGCVLERQWGNLRFVVFYFLCGIGAALVHNTVNAFQFSALHDHLLAQGLGADTIQLALDSGRSAVPLTAETKTALVDLYHIYSVPMIGASGAIYGILVAFGFLYPNAKLALLFIPVPIAAKFMIPALLAFDLLSGVTGISLFGGGIAHFAHLGGALIGLVLMLLWRRPSAAAQSFSAAP